jgi:hypothetical protein
MRCKTVINFRINGGNGGRDYTFVCAGCRHYVTELSTGRVLYLGTLIVSGIGLGGMLVVFGLKMLVDLVTRGPGGNDLSALIVVLVLFLGLGLPFFLMSLWSARSLIQDWRELNRNPIVG